MLKRIIDALRAFRHLFTPFTEEEQTALVLGDLIDREGYDNDKGTETCCGGPYGQHIVRGLQADTLFVDESVYFKDSPRFYKQLNEDEMEARGRYPGEFVTPEPACFDYDKPVLKGMPKV